MIRQVWKQSSKTAIVAKSRFAVVATLMFCKSVYAKCICVLTISTVGISAFADTGSSPEFQLDLRGLGPWQRHTAAASETLTYSSAWATNAAVDAKAFVKVMPVLKAKPKYLVIDLSGGISATHYPISYLDEVPGGSWSDEYKTSKLVLRHIPAGSFIMGGRATDYPGAVNTNLHMVTITRDFYMGVFEVTQRQWELVMGTRPSAMKNTSCYASRPVEQVSYCDIRGLRRGTTWPSSTDVDEDSFLGRIRLKSSLNGWDLPTEAQWEYACRAGTTTALNSGENHSSISAGTEAVKVARCAYNSGVSETGGQYYNMDVYLNSTTEKATAKVGTYMANQFGLYDMHGNVFEWCLDKWSSNAFGSVDPVGPVESSIVKHVMKGAAWHAMGMDGVCSGARTDGGTGMTETTRFQTVGFRLCLQGGDVLDFAAASTLVNESGTGSQSWIPTRSGAYYLTHSTMNGETNAQLLSAWFEVPGCQLTLEPQGELTNGVVVAITGAGEGWTIYYTTNGLVPSTASTEYTGPFSLPESATVRAVAYNAQGVASEETTTSFTLHDALSAVGAIARPRYPWNGMVDIDCEIKGDPEAKYEVDVVAMDLEGGTNLTVKTVSLVDAMVPIASDKDDSSSSNAIGTIASTLAPGTYRLTWNADADIAHDHDFPRVAVTVKATKQSVLAGYARQFAISTDGYAGGETLTGVPVLVRLSTAIDGFDYRDFASSSNGADLAFFDANEQPLPYEIDEWHTNGESLVWVKLPELRRGTRFTCAYGSERGSRSEELGIADKHLVWREYAGVWHMNEDSGTAFDSTEHGLDALPSKGSNASADTSQMIACENAACGKGRVNGIAELAGGNYLAVPSYDGLALNSDFVVSGWFYVRTKDKAPRLISRKPSYTTDSGWEVLVASENDMTLVARGRAANKTVKASAPTVTAGWLNVVACYSGTELCVYTNSAISAVGEIDVATNNGLELAFGSGSQGGERSLAGQYDEIRLRGGSLSADRIKADYDMIANRAFCTYGAVKGAK